MKRDNAEIYFTHQKLKDSIGIGRGYRLMIGILGVYSFVIRFIIPICSLGPDQVVVVSISIHSNREIYMYH